MNSLMNIPEYEVSQFNRMFKEVVEVNFDYVRIRGEISELKNAASGHMYLTLKDDNSVLNATLWSQKINYLQIIPEIGMEVIVSGKISTYAKSISTYSINIDKLELAGEGALLKIIEERKKRLRENGVFDNDHKIDIPYLPNKIGVITSTTGSVIHDIINRIKDRFPTNIDIWPVSVQGISAAESIVNAVEGFNHLDDNLKPDIIIIARGGGSTEDLMPFNDERLALTVYDSKIPIISAIGHETDTTIIDYVSDLRASTPTAAAEKAVPVKSELEYAIQNLYRQMNHLIANSIYKTRSHIDSSSKFLKAPNLIIKSYKEKINKSYFLLYKEVKNIFNISNIKKNNLEKLLKSPQDIFEGKKIFLQKLSSNLDRNINFDYTDSAKEFNKLIRLLDSNSLNSNLKKGYSIIKKSKKIINKSKYINVNDEIEVQFYDKLVKLRIKKTN